LRRQMSTAASAYAFREFSAEQQGLHYLEFFQRIVEEE
jgi:hypothetical protein